MDPKKENEEIIIRGFDDLYDVIFTTDDFKHIELEWRDTKKYIKTPIEPMDSDININFNDVIETKYFTNPNREIRIWIHAQKSVRTNEIYERVFLWCGYDQTAYKGFLNKKKDGNGWVSYLKTKPQTDSIQS